MLAFRMDPEKNINYQRVAQAIAYLEQNIHRQPELNEVADEVHLSPFHFQKIFTEWVGISPKKFLQFLTVDYLKGKLHQTQNLIEAAVASGLSSQSRVYDLFTTVEAVTPQEYKFNGAGIVIEYGFHHTPFGFCLIGTTTRGICWLSFLEETEKETSLDALTKHWHNSQLDFNQSSTATIVANAFYSNGKNQSPTKINLLVKGTNFQIKVWEALLQLPIGAVTTYQDVARQIANPRALQAVGSAVGANHIAYLIPCHRVIRKDGILGEYRWSPLRKKAMLGWEMAKCS